MASINEGYLAPLLGGHGAYCYMHRMTSVNRESIVVYILVVMLHEISDIWLQLARCKGHIMIWCTGHIVVCYKRHMGS